MQDGDDRLPRTELVTDPGTGRTATIEDLLIWEPCWLDEEEDWLAGGEELIRELAGERTKWSPADVAGLYDAIGLSREDWRWLMLRYLAETGRLGVVIAWTDDCAGRAQEAVDARLAKLRAAWRRPGWPESDPRRPATWAIWAAVCARTAAFAIGDGERRRQDRELIKLARGP